MNILEIKNVSISFGGLKAVDSVDLEINENEIMSIIDQMGQVRLPYSI